MTHHDKTLTDATPDQVKAWLANGEILLVDVREVAEYASERIHGALLYPLSTFDPQALPREGRRLVLQCAGGVRSAKAAHKLLEAGFGHVTHLAGGLQAWKAAGLPTVRIDPQSGRVIDDGRR
ncbi:MAG TPA: rhodanese-like domain-containing protein [Steroidobacteraceae bacterium]